MKAVTWCGKNDVKVQNVPDPKILNPRDAIVRITATAICGSDLHLYDGYIPGMMRGDILGHEPMGIVEEVGPGVDNLKPGDRVVIPFTIACGGCFFCNRQLFSLCDNSNPKAAVAEKMFGYSPSGVFGYSHLTGGYAGGQAEYLRVPFANTGPIKVPEELPDEKVLFLSDVLPTAWMAAEQADIEPGDTVAVWGCGPVGLLTIVCAYAMGAEKVIALDSVQERLDMAASKAKGIPVRIDDEYVYERLLDLTGGRGPDSCIDAVGQEAHASTLDAWLDAAKINMWMGTDHAHVIRQAINCCRKGGTVSIPGVYGGYADKIPVGAMMNKGLTIKTGQTHVQRYLKPLLEKIQRGELDPSFIITHQLPLSEAPRGYDMFKHKEDNCVKVVLRPN